jgi:hypothetical protein
MHMHEIKHFTVHYLVASELHTQANGLTVNKVVFS